MIATLLPASGGGAPRWWKVSNRPSAWAGGRFKPDTMRQAFACARSASGAPGRIR